MYNLFKRLTKTNDGVGFNVNKLVKIPPQKYENKKNKEKTMSNKVSQMTADRHSLLFKARSCSSQRSKVSE